MNNNIHNINKYVKIHYVNSLYSIYFQFKCTASNTV